MRILLLDKNHPLITEQLLAKNFILEEDFYSTYEEVLKKIELYDGIIIRSRIPLDQNFLEKAKKPEIYCKSWSRNGKHTHPDSRKTRNSAH